MKRESCVVTVVGLGLIGGSISYALKKKGFRLKGVSSAGTVQKALEMQVIHEGFDYSQIEEAVQGSSYVFICTPLFDIEKRMPQIFGCAERGTVVTDAGSTKAPICRNAERCLSKGLYFVGGHPMAGSEKQGLKNARPYLFYDAVWVLTPIPGTPKKVVGGLSALIAQMGAKVMLLSPQLHDRIAASVSHLPQLLAILLTNHLASKSSDLFRNLAAGGFRDMTRIASSSYSIWKDILRTNTDEIRVALTSFSEELSTTIERIADEGYIEELFSIANRERRTIPKYTKGFLKPLYEVRVTVEDRPGELARITNLIYYRDVNIKDIEIVTVREGEGGILRLGFSQKSEAEDAAAALTACGYEVAAGE